MEEETKQTDEIMKNQIKDSHPQANGGELNKPAPEIEKINGDTELEYIKKETVDIKEIQKAVEEDEKNEIFYDKISINNQIEEIDQELSTEIFPPSRIILYAKRLFIGSESLRFDTSLYRKYPNNIYIKTCDDQNIGAFIYAPEETNKETQYFVICHGKGCERTQVDAFVDFYTLSKANNAVFLLLDYRSFGDSSGEYTIKGVNYDVLAGIEYLRERFAIQDVSIVSHSLGTAIALEYGRFALRERRDCMPKKIFCLAPFTSTIEIVKDFRIFSLFKLFVPFLEEKIEREFNYRSLSNAKHLKDILYVFHGSNDTVVLRKHGDKIHEESKCFYKVTNNNHINIFNDFSIWSEILEINKS